MRPRFRELGLKVGVLETGRNNSITDVEGVKVGHVTLIKGSGKLVPGKGPVRTGVTVILPHNGNIYREKVPASYYVINGFGKPFGLIQVGELGEIETPIALTNTLNVGLVADAIIDYVIDLNPKAYTINPVVLECNDAYLNDIQGRHVRKDHVFKAIEEASNWVEEGAVGAGTGMSSFEFKSGIGTSSRIAGEYTVGVLVEELLEKNFPVVIIDPHGEYSSMIYENRNEKELPFMERFGIEPKAYGNQVQVFTITDSPNQLKLDSRLTMSEFLEILPRRPSSSQQGLLYAALNNLKGRNYTIRDIIEEINEKISEILCLENALLKRIRKISTVLSERRIARTKRARPETVKGEETPKIKPPKKRMTRKVDYNYRQLTRWM